MGILGLPGYSLQERLKIAASGIELKEGPPNAKASYGIVNLCLNEQPLCLCEIIDWRQTCLIARLCLVKCHVSGLQFNRRVVCDFSGCGKRRLGFLEGFVQVFVYQLLTGLFGSNR